MAYETLYKIYAIKGYWFGPLNQLIKELDSEVENKSIVPDLFAISRLGCAKKCLSRGGCSICTKIEETSEMLEERILYFKYKK
jgi:hypothetical protein